MIKFFIFAPPTAIVGINFLKHIFMGMKFTNYLSYCLTIVLLLVTAGSGRAQFGIINTVAGNGTGTFAGDGGAATTASLNSPVGIWVDVAGDLYIADQANNRIRKVTTSTGIITTIAGSGAAGYTGDGGLALTATLNSPTGVFVDATGNIFIADFGNNVIRKVSGGIITTVAGTGAAGFSGDGGLATAATLNNPFGIWVEASGNIIFTDQGNVRVRKVDGATGIITTIAGTGTPGFCCDGSPATAATFSHPSGICEDPSGVIYFCTQGGNARVRKIDLAGIIHTEMGNGTPGFSGDCGQATDAEIRVPQGVVSDPAGNIYLATTSDYRIRLVEAATGIIHTVAGDGATSFSGDGGSPLSAGMNPNGVTLDAAGNIYVSGDNRVRKITLALTNDTVNFCHNDSAILGSATTYVDSFRWSTGATTSSITVHTGGTYWVKMFVCTYVSTDTFVVHDINTTVALGNDTTICAGAALTLGSSAAYAYAPVTYTWNTGATTATIPATGTGNYWLSVSEMGCPAASDTIHVTVNPLPPVHLGNDTAICAGNTVTLQSSDVYTAPAYHWSTGSTASSINVTATGSYSLAVTDGTCTGADTIAVTVNAAPAQPTYTVVLPLCSGTTLNLAAADATAGVSWQWTGPNGFSSAVQNPAIPNITMAGNGIYTVTAALAGCVSLPVTVAVIVDSTPATPVASNTSPVCSGGNISFSAFSNTTGVTYSWSGPPPFSSTLENPSITNASAVESGLYTVTATLAAGNAAGGCSSTATTTVVVNQTPTIPTVGNNGPVCEGGLLILSSVATPGSGIYYWTGPNSFTSALEYPQINNVTLAAAGVYTVYEVVNGCTSPAATDTVVIRHTPAAPVVVANTPVCEGGTIHLYAADTSIGVTYGWSGPLSFTSTDQNPVISNAPLTASGIYLATVSLGICTATSPISVSVTPTPSLTAGSNSPICSGDTLKLFSTSDPGVTYHWAAPYPLGFSDSTAQNPTRFPTTLEYAGVYTVTVVSGAATGSCPATLYDTVVINGAPAPTWVSWLTYCQNYNAPPLQAVDATNVLWYPSAAAGATGTATAPTPATGVPGVFYYYLNETVSGCPSPIDSIQVTIDPSPVVTVTPSMAAICPHDSVLLTANDADPLDTYHWYPDIYTDDTLHSTMEVHPLTSQDYMVVVQNHFGCTDTARTAVTVHPAGIIFFSVGDSIVLHPGDSYHIQPSTNCAFINWFPPVGLSAANITDPVAMPSTNTMYVAEGTTEFGCRVTDSLYFHVTDETIYGVPNAFTPGNGTNTIFKLIEEGQGSLNYFRIFDRWGVQVFETNTVENGWDGNYKGQPQPQGVYVYDIQAVSSRTGKIVSMQGNITLLR